MLFLLVFFDDFAVDFPLEASFFDKSLDLDEADLDFNVDEDGLFEFDFDFDFED